jgi:hypothetical protein
MLDEEDDEKTTVWNALATADWVQCQPDAWEKNTPAVRKLSDTTFPFENKRLRQVCCCSGCAPWLDGELKERRNYANRHCLDCRCKWCVCDARRYSGTPLYNSYCLTPYWDGACGGCCSVCKEVVDWSDGGKHRGLSSIAIQRLGCEQYTALLETAEIDLLRQCQTVIGGATLLPKGCVQIILLFVTVDPRWVCEECHKGSV